jgi:hypothetical protein
VDGDCDGGEVCYVDADGDGYRPDALATIVSADGDCDDDGEAVADDPIGDCEDDDLETNPGADEVWYDGVDGDCQSGNDYDADGDGYVHEDYDAYAAGAAQDIDDCDDDDPDRNPGADEVHDNGADENCDGYDPVALTAIAAGDLVITELMIAPAAVDDSTGEWVEVYNRSGLDVDLLDLRVREGGVGHIDILDPLVLPADAWMIFARSGDSARNGGLPTDALIYDYTAAGAALGFRDTSDDVYLSNGDESVIFDSLSYDVDAGWPVTSGASMSLSARAIDADLGDAPTAWCPAVDPYGDGDLGTPGAANPSCE